VQVWALSPQYLRDMATLVADHLLIVLVLQVFTNVGGAARSRVPQVLPFIGA
jgi:hypothetical protein